MSGKATRQNTKADGNGNTVCAYDPGADQQQQFVLVVSGRSQVRLG